MADLAAGLIRLNVLLMARFIFRDALETTDLSETPARNVRRRVH